MGHQKFDLAKLEKLNDPGRFDTLIPEAMWDALAVKAPRAIVEIGAGTGMFASRFAEFAPAAVVYAVDMEPAMIDWLRENRPLVAEGRIVPVLSQEAAIPLQDGVADAVVMINLHHELAEPDALYGEAHRLLRPGGRVMVVDWAPIETPRGPSMAVRATPALLMEHLERAGFADVAEHGRVLPWHSLVTATKDSARQSTVP